MTASPALYQGAIFLLAGNADDQTFTVNALDMESGHEIWKKIEPGSIGGDSQSVMVFDDTVIFPMMSDKSSAGSNMWYAMNSSDGSHLWDYVSDEVFWNAVPATPGDGTLLFGGSCGGAFRITFGGELLWRAGAPAEPNHMCSTGGGSVGPNGVFYTEYTQHDGSAQISAFQISNGTLLWERNFAGYGGGQYPAVGKLGLDGPLAVVVAIGDNPGIMNPLVTGDPHQYLSYFEDPAFRETLGVPKMVNAVVAMDAASGDVLWRWEEDIWDHFAAAGDEEKEMLIRAATHSPENEICLPDLQGIPLIAGDGTVYASSSHAGDLTSIRDADGDGIIDPSEVSAFVTHKAFLNSPSLAPGMLVAAPCWGTMYVFKS